MKRKHIAIAIIIGISFWNTRAETVNTEELTVLEGRVLITLYDFDNNGTISIAEAEAVLGAGNVNVDSDGLLDIFDANTSDAAAAPTYLDSNGSVNDPTLLSDENTETPEVNYRESSRILDFMRHGKHFQNGEEKHMYFGNSR